MGHVPEGQSGGEGDAAPQTPQHPGPHRTDLSTREADSGASPNGGPQVLCEELQESQSPSEQNHHSTDSHSGAHHTLT